MSEDAVTVYNAYETVPIERRLCTSCRKSILKNIALFDGELYHFGCLKNDERFGESVAQCHECFSYLTAKLIVKTEYGFGRLERSCGNCGSQTLKDLWRQPQEWQIAD